MEVFPIDHKGKRYFFMPSEMCLRYLERHTDAMKFPLDWLDKNPDVEFTNAEEMEGELYGFSMNGDTVYVLPRSVDGMKALLTVLAAELTNHLN